MHDLCTILPDRRSVLSIPNGPSALAVKEAAWGHARYAAISQVIIVYLLNSYYLYLSSPYGFCNTTVTDELGKYLCWIYRIMV